MSENQSASSTPCNQQQPQAPATQGQGACCQGNANGNGKPNKGNRKKK